MLQGAIAGLAVGAVYAVLAIALMLMAQLVRVINFALAGIGMFGAFLMIWVSHRGVPVWLAIVLGLVVAMALSMAVGEVITRWLASSTVSARSAVTVALLLLLISTSFILFGTKPQPFRPLVEGPAVTIGGVVISRLTVLLLVIALAVGAGATVVLARTDVGSRLRAIADRPVAAELLGIPVRRLSLAVWAVLGGVVALVIIIVAPTQTSDALSLSMLIIPAAAAALAGAFRSLATAFAAGLGLGMVQGATAQVGALSLVSAWIPLVLIVVFLLWSQRREVWDEAP